MRRHTITLKQNKNIPKSPTISSRSENYISLLWRKIQIRIIGSFDGSTPIVIQVFPRLDANTFFGIGFFFKYIVFKKFSDNSVYLNVVKIEVSKFNAIQTFVLLVQELESNECKHLAVSSLTPISVCRFYSAPTRVLCFQTKSVLNKPMENKQNWCIDIPVPECSKQ